MIDYRVIRSKRKTLAVEITDEGVLVRAPIHMPDRHIRRFLEEKAAWIDTRLRRRTAWLQQPAFTQEEIKELANRAAKVIPERVAYYAQLLKVPCGRISIRCQRTRWGSCSGKGNLNFNCLLMLAPPQVLDYVVVHELCHLMEMNHSTRFWSLVSSTLPDYQTQRRWLKDNGSALIHRLPK